MDRDALVALEQWATTRASEIWMSTFARQSHDEEIMRDSSDLEASLVRNERYPKCTQIPIPPI